MSLIYQPLNIFLKKLPSSVFYWVLNTLLRSVSRKSLITASIWYFFAVTTDYVWKILFKRILLWLWVKYSAQKMKIFPLRIWSHSLKKSLMKNFIFCAVHLLREVIELLWKIKFVLCNEFLVSIVIRFFNLVCCSWTTTKSEIWVYCLWISSNDNSVIRNRIFKRGKKCKVVLGV